MGASKTDSAERQPRSWAKRIVFILAGLVLLAVIGKVGSIILIANKPVEGTIITQAQQPKTNNASGTKTLKTAYYATQYPAHYTTLTKPTNSASLDAEMLSAPGQNSSGTSSKIALTVTNLPEGGVTQDSSYNLFKAHPETYKLEQLTVQGEPVYVGTRTIPDYERTYLWAHGTHLLTVALTTDVQSAAADSELQSILDHVQWTAK
jgi:hypothetical protein